MEGDHPSMRVCGYTVVGPEMQGHRCGVCGSEGWKAGVPRVGRWWDVESSGWWHIGCGGWQRVEGSSGGRVACNGAGGK